MRCVTKAKPFKFIDGNILKSCRTGLTDHTQPISHYITPLVINALRVDVHTHTNTHTYKAHILMHKQKDFKKPGTCSLRPHTPGLKITVFKEMHIN